MGRGRAHSLDCAGTPGDRPGEKAGLGQIDGDEERRAERGAGEAVPPAAARVASRQKPGATRHGDGCLSVPAKGQEPPEPEMRPESAPGASRQTGAWASASGAA